MTSRKRLARGANIELEPVTKIKKLRMVNKCDEKTFQSQHHYNPVAHNDKDTSDIDKPGQDINDRGGENVTISKNGMSNDSLKSHYPPSTQRNISMDSAYGSDVNDEIIDEGDVIHVSEPESHEMDSPDAGIYYSSWFKETTVPGKGNLISKRTPSQSDDLFVTHRYKTDSELGDRFGAKLDTFDKTKDGEYNRHVFKNIETGSPADKMMLRNDDEAVLINNSFVPAMDHSEVLNLIHDLKVDGETRNSLVIRRKLSGQKRWQWYESSAVFSPDPRKIPQFDKTPPNVKDQSFEELPNNRTHFSVHNRYRLQSQDIFLDIKPGGVSMSPLHNNKDTDKTKIITKQVHISQDDEGEYIYWCCLCGYDAQSYLAINTEKMTVHVQGHEPKPFKFKNDASNIYFQYDDKRIKGYLSYDGHNITVSDSEYMFEEIPLDGIDHCDACSVPSQNSSLDDSGYSPSPRGSGYFYPSDCPSGSEENLASRRSSFNRVESVGLSGPTIKYLNI